MSKIVVIRHAKSDWHSNTSDFERVINKEGQKSCQIISQELKKRITKPDKFIVSTAIRAQLTHQEIFFSWYNELELEKNTINDELLYSGTVGKILTNLKMNLTGFNTSVIIGHNPILNYVLNVLAFKGQNLIPNNLVEAGCVLISYETNHYNQTNFKEGTIIEYINPKQFLK